MDVYGGNEAMGSIDSAFRRADAGFAQKLADLDPLYHAGFKGARYEDCVRSAVGQLLPGGCAVSEGLLDGADCGITKQIDIGVHPQALPLIFQDGSTVMYQPEWLWAVGEIKVGLTSGGIEGVEETAVKINRFLSCIGLRVPFLLIVGRACPTPARIARLVDDIATSCPNLWPAAFLFTMPGNDRTGSIVAVDETSPIAARVDGEGLLSGVCEFDAATISPTAMMYLMLWAGVHRRLPLLTMDYDFMRTVVTKVTTDEPLESKVRVDGSVETKYVSLFLSEGAPRPVVRNRSVTVPAPDVAEPAEPLASTRKVMLISLGQWVDQYDAWSEAPWGGGIESRDGYGYRPDMSDHDLLQSARVFWSFKPTSGNWGDLEFAVVVHKGVTRAVIRIDKYIGPLWDRYGFRGEVVHDSALDEELVGKIVKGRQNPVTVWRGSVAAS